MGGAAPSPTPPPLFLDCKLPALLSREEMNVLPSDFAQNQDHEPPVYFVQTQDYEPAPFNFS